MLHTARARSRSRERSDVPGEVTLPLEQTTPADNEEEDEVTVSRKRASEKGAQVPFLSLDVTSDNARGLFGTKGGPTVNLFLHAINAYNASTDPKDQIQYQECGKFNGSHKNKNLTFEVFERNA